MNMTVNASTNATYEVVIEGLTVYVEYTVSIQAVTGGGGGDVVSGVKRTLPSRKSSLCVQYNTFCTKSTCSLHSLI